MQVGPYHLKWYHQPPTTVEYEGSQYVINGHTVCALKYHGQPYAVGIARCNPVDQWSRAKGRIIALQHAVESASRETRSFIWNGFWERRKSC